MIDIRVSMISVSKKGAGHRGARLYRLRDVIRGQEEVARSVSRICRIGVNIVPALEDSFFKKSGHRRPLGVDRVWQTVFGCDPSESRDQRLERCHQRRDRDVTLCQVPSSEVMCCLLGSGQGLRSVGWSDWFATWNVAVVR